MMKRKIMVLMPWLLRISPFTSLCFSFPFSTYTLNAYGHSSTLIPSSNTTEKYFSETNVVNLVLPHNLRTVIPLIMLSMWSPCCDHLSQETDTLYTHGKQWQRLQGPQYGGSHGSHQSYQLLFHSVHFQCSRSISSMSNIFDIDSSWDILCKIIKAAYPASHSVLLTLGNPGLRRAWKQFQHGVHLTYQGRLCGWGPQTTTGPGPNSSASSLTHCLAQSKLLIVCC
ncbi:Taste receptor type 2 member 40 [Manis javanica]|nr:Taste receptor type 2 member 40 [Manis javanica]